MLNLGECMAGWADLHEFLKDDWEGWQGHIAMLFLRIMNSKMDACFIMSRNHHMSCIDW